MGNYIKLQLENILTEGQTIAPEYCDKKYVIYYNPKETRQKVRINTDYYQYLKNDSNAWSTFDKALKLKLTYMKKEYYGEAVYQGSGTKCYTVFDDQCPLNVQITKTSMWIENEEYKFYILVEAKIE